MRKAFFLWDDLHLNGKVSHNQVKHTEEAVAMIASELMALFRPNPLWMMPAQAVLFRCTGTLNCNVQISARCGAHWHGRISVISATSPRSKGKMVGTTEENALSVGEVTMPRKMGRSVPDQGFSSFPAFSFFSTCSGSRWHKADLVNKRQWMWHTFREKATGRQMRL